MTRNLRNVPAGDRFVWFPEIAPAGDWINQAACRGHDRTQWFPRTADNGTYRAAVKICAACPVRAACLEYSITNRIRSGIWGGQGERRRKALMRGAPPTRRRPTPLHGSASRYQYGCHCVDCREAHRVAAARYREAGTH